MGYFCYILNRFPNNIPLEMENDEDFPNLLRFKDVMNAEKHVPLSSNFYEEFYFRNRQSDDTESATSSNKSMF